MATVMNLDRIDELSNHPVRAKEGEFEHLCAMAKRTFELEERYRQLGDLQSEVDQWKQRDTDAGKKLGEWQIELVRAHQDMTIAENYIGILRRGLKEAVVKDQVFRRFHDDFVKAIHGCIDGEELPPVCALNSTLLRLQEALDTNPAK